MQAANFVIIYNDAYKLLIILSFFLSVDNLVGNSMWLEDCKKSNFYEFHHGFFSNNYL